MRVVVSTAIPLSILFTFAAMYGMDIYIHQMSLTALIIALGILVDNAIVISDGIQVNLDGGQDNGSASVNAVKKSSNTRFYSDTHNRSGSFAFDGNAWCCRGVSHLHSAGAHYICDCVLCSSYVCHACFRRVDF